MDEDIQTYLFCIVHDGSVRAELAHLCDGVDALLGPGLCVEERLIDRVLRLEIYSGESFSREDRTETEVSYRNRSHPTSRDVAVSDVDRMSIERGLTERR